MIYNWMISVPVWGDYHISRFVSFVLPSIKEALRTVKGSVRFVIHTDRPKDIAAHLDGFEVKYFPQPMRSTPIHKGVGKTRYIQVGDADRASLSESRMGEAVAMAYADTVICNGFFSAAERRFAEGNKLIMMIGLRAIDEVDPPIGANAKHLLRWAWNNQHPWITQCTWGKVESKQPAALFFEREGTVVSHWYTLYSFAMIKDRPLGFNALTIDHGKGISSQFREDEIYVASGYDEVGCASMTPRSHDLGSVGKFLNAEELANWAWHRLNERNLWLFKHRMRIMGDGDPGDVEVCNRILANYRARPARPQ